MQGEGRAEVVGNETIIRALRKAADKKEVKAIVLRINSPGGDALASELRRKRYMCLWAITLLQEAII